eukprot:TRINITY_DN26473_c0_g1_i1.p1 TRINITY_DN26473_c0_g1~~TRINITY_DN26473_c0_g1_i1.p1  ORF type:complete len:417 (-),score=59.18 TRINITY_DN26473_c0_g1_i1:104-1354(-)
MAQHLRSPAAWPGQGKPAEIQNGSQSHETQNDGHGGCMDILCSVMGMDVEPPFYVLFIGLLLTPWIHAAVFEPIRLAEGRRGGPLTVLLQYWSAISFFMTMLLDFFSLLKIMFSTLAFSQKIGGFVLVAAMSPNIAAGIMMSAIANLYEQGRVWRKTHNHDDAPSFDDALRTQGRFLPTYASVARIAGAIPGLLAFIYCAPAFVAYFWLSLPVGGVLLGCTYCCHPYGVKMMFNVPDVDAEYRTELLPPSKNDTVRPRSEADMDAKASSSIGQKSSWTSSQRHKNDEDSFEGQEEGPSEQSASESRTDHDGGEGPSSMQHEDEDGEFGDEQRAESTLVRCSGAPWVAWANYFFVVSEIFLLVFFAPVAVRLYSGQGYSSSLWQTTSERSTDRWLHGLMSPGFAGLRQWLMSVNWVV